MKAPAHRAAVGLCLSLLAIADVAAAQEPVAPEEPVAGEEPVADGREAEARALFEAGHIAYRDGRFLDSYRRFAESYELSGKAELLFNMGLSADRARMDAEAIEAYRAYLERMPSAENRATVETRLAELERYAAERTEEEGSTGGPGVLPVVLLGASALVAAGGGVLVGIAASDVAAIESASRGERWEEYEGRDARTVPMSIAGFAMIGVGAVGLALGLVLLSGGGDEESVAVAITPAGAALGGRF